MKNMIKRIFCVLVPLIFLAGCGSKEPEKSIVASNFVYYDFTRELTKGTDISVGLVTSKELSGRDKNKLKTAGLLVGFDEYGTSDSFFRDKNRIFIPAAVESCEIKAENNRISDSSYKLFGEKTEEKDKNGAVVPEPQKPTQSTEQDKQTEGPEGESTEAPDVKNPDADTESSNPDTKVPDTETEQESGNKVSGITLLINEAEDYSVEAPSSSNGSGYSIQTMPKDYVLDKNDAYDQWVINRIKAIKNSQRSFIGYAAIENGGGYTLFTSVHNGITYKVMQHNAINDIEVLPFFNTNYVFCEKKAESLIKGPSAKTAVFDENYWMDVKKSMRIVEAIRQGLVKTYPEDEAVIEANYQEYIKKLESLDERIQKEVDNSNNGLIFVCGAFTYGNMTEGYGIDYISIYDDAQSQESASLSRLTAFAGFLNEHGIKYVLKDKNSDTEAMTSLKDSLDHNVTVLILDTMETKKDTEKSYLGIMEDNLLILKKALY